MSVYIAVAAIIAAIIGPYVIAWNFRRAKARLAYAEKIWDNVEQSARVLLEDRHLDPRIGDFIDFVVGELGSGRMTRIALKAVLHPKKSPRPMPELTGGQGVQFGRFMLSALLFDSLHTTFSGFILRRWLYWLTTTVGDKKAVVTEPQVAPVVEAADRMWHSKTRICVPA
ncbi:hypothetical protein [Sphingopyxis sp. 113P3]|uniref:hypothetical protein n=1 Tax=Sphingopyxis sp. (strain 113P3) TaxID=292913 RepID=UPI0006AD4305|nr:hypothetical protein [Sphingopyxis sp. 113P3]ALC12457.1 hypothetical protein LH20_10895 [Sphingopyxis sp. 113P3]